MKGPTLAAFVPAPARRLLRVGAFVFLWAVAPASAANPSMSDDFQRMMGWLSHEMAQGLAFNAGSTFDPPKEVKSRRLQPDVSLGVGRMALNKTTFPEPRVAALRDLDAQSIFPSSILFPNLVAHLRAALPGRMDLSLRFTDMTTPPGYKISPTTTGKGQSNTFGIGLRRHFFGGDLPSLAVGANYNHVYGRFTYQTKFKINNISGFSADSDVNGALAWNINSFGLNGVVSQAFGKWTPFAGLGYNYATGSVRAHLQVDSQTPVIAPIVGEASDHPEANQGRVILGASRDGSWMDFFLNGEVKALGQQAGKSWIVHAGVSLPFRIGTKGFYPATAPETAVEAPRAPEKEKKAPKPAPAAEGGAAQEDLEETIFIR